MGFKIFDGMDENQSTLEERQEIYSLLYDKKMLYSQDGIDKETRIKILSKNGFYLNKDGLFLPDHNDMIKINHIPFEGFKNKLGLCH